MNTCKVDEVMTLLDNVEQKFLNMKSATASEDILTKQNVPRPLPKSMASQGVLITSLVPDNVNLIKNLVFIPKGGEVKHHFHEEHEELITVWIGCVNYSIHKINESEAIKEGELCAGDSLFINPKLMHYVFTTKVESYMQVEFKKVDGK